MKHKSSTYHLIVIGVSSGGMAVINQLVASLPGDFTLPIIVVQHLFPTSGGEWIHRLNDRGPVHVKEADEKEKIQPGTIYFAPANYHLLLEPDFTFTLTVDEKVNYARLSIDVLFETAAESFGEFLIGIICTGANSDGAKGLLRIKEAGGLTIVQDPEQAEISSMPLEAIKTASPDLILPLEGIIELLLDVGRIHKEKSYEMED